MKKLFSFLMIAVTLCIMTACGGNAEKAKDVYSKIQSGQTLDNSDYDVIIDYLNDAFEEINKADSPEEFEKIEKKYEYADAFVNALDDAPEEVQNSPAAQKLLMNIMQTFAKFSEYME